MNHHASPSFWTAYGELPQTVRERADANFDLLERNSAHPSLHFKKLDRYWSARVGRRHRAPAVEVDDGLLWFWIGSQAAYDRMIHRGRAKPRRVRPELPSTTGT